MSSQRLLTRREIAEALGYNHRTFSTLISRNVRIFPATTKRGPTYLYNRDAANRMMRFARARQFTSPLPRINAGEFFTQALTASRKSATRAMQKLSHVSCWDKIRKA